MTESGPWPGEHLGVRLYGQPCGALWQQGGDMHFAYSEGWLLGERPVPVSQSLPLRAEPYRGQRVEAFFGNLLPEGDVRSRVSRALQISSKNDYALLEAIGGDCAGALSLEHPEAPTPAASSSAGSLLDRAALDRLIKNLPARPLMVGELGLRLSLAGAQTKLALCLAGETWVMPGPGGITTHILKPPIRDFDSSVENEVFCMRLAADSGLGVATCWVESNPRIYVTERYDRHRPPTGKVERVHQEDFCQALGCPPERKYQSEGGPGFKECFALIRKACADPAGESLRLLRLVIFNVMIGNHDAHAKNLSLLYRKNGVVLAPFYDLLSTAIYPGLSKHWAMRIGKARNSRYFSIGNWDDFARDCDLNPAFVRRELRLFSKAIQRRAHQLAVEFSPRPSVIDQILAEIDDNFRRVERQLLAADTLKKRS